MIFAMINTILDILISLSLIYLVTSMLSIAIVEWIAHISGTRELGMEEALKAIYKAADKDDLKSRINENSLLKEFFLPKEFLLSRMGSFKSKYLLGEMDLPKWIPESAIVNPEVATHLKISEQQLALRFKAVMARQTDKFRSNARLRVFLVACVIGLCLSLDSINIAQQLYTNPAIREALVAQAKEVTQNDAACPDPNKLDECYLERRKTLLKSLKVFDPPIGTPFSFNQDKEPKGISPWQTLFGILITAFATSQGAPFWFQILQQLLAWRKVTNPDS
jgi:hypothetical protein